MGRQNIHTFIYKKTFFYTFLLLVFKIPKSRQCNFNRKSLSLSLPPSLSPSLPPSLSLSLKHGAAIQNNFKQPNEAVLKIEQKTSLKNHSAKRFKSTQSEIM